MRFADRMYGVHRSYIREILKVTADPSVISFAGGLPNPDCFPVAALKSAAAKALEKSGAQALQYSTTEGHPPLREYIADRLARKHGIDADPARILITTGSQQGLDLAAKVLLNPGDTVVLERPGYLGAIQCFSLYGASFAPVDLEEDGPDMDALARVFEERSPRLFYCVPNFQNPSGLTWSREKRLATARLAEEHGVVLLEDNPYGDLRFLGDDIPLLANFATDSCLHMGSFSKSVSPGLRLGWCLAPRDTTKLMVTAKQASDLHTSSLAQHTLTAYLEDNDLDAHIREIAEKYGQHRDLMLEVMNRYFPDPVTYTHPEGGMFLWVTLPDSLDAAQLFDLAIKDKVAFVPGAPFFTDGGGARNMRLNFSNSSPENIEIGVTRLAATIEAMLE